MLQLLAEDLQRRPRLTRHPEAVAPRSVPLATLPESRAFSIRSTSSGLNPIASWMARSLRTARHGCGASAGSPPRARGPCPAGRGGPVQYQRGAGLARGFHRLIQGHRRTSPLTSGRGVITSGSIVTSHPEQVGAVAHGQLEERPLPALRRHNAGLLDLPTPALMPSSSQSTTNVRTVDALCSKIADSRNAY